MTRISREPIRAIREIRGCLFFVARAGEIQIYIPKFRINSTYIRMATGRAASVKS
jgi:hypothetical protein